MNKTAFFFALSFLALIFASEAALGFDWPDGPWINGSPRSSSAITAVAFVAPSDLQFQRMMRIWRKLDKRYSSMDVEFLIVAMQEPLFPFSDTIVEASVKDASYSLPVYVDLAAHYSKLWRAYVSPTVDLVLRNGKVTSFDPGNFDPFVFEKTLQKLLKEGGAAVLPPREFSADLDLKNCHSHSMFLGNRFQKTWNNISASFDDTWEVAPFWAQWSPDKKDVRTAQIEVPVTRSEVGVLAESHPGSARVNVMWDGQRVPAELRGHDVQEDKMGVTFVNVGGPRVYEVIAHGTRERDSQSKLTFTTESKGIKLWAFQFLPACMESAF